MRKVVGRERLPSTTSVVNALMNSSLWVDTSRRLLLFFIHDVVEFAG